MKIPCAAGRLFPSEPDEAFYPLEVAALLAYERSVRSAFLFRSTSDRQCPMSAMELSIFGPVLVACRTFAVQNLVECGDFSVLSTHRLRLGQTLRTCRERLKFVLPNPHRPASRLNRV